MRVSLFLLQLTTFTCIDCLHSCASSLEAITIEIPDQIGFPQSKEKYFWKGQIHIWQGSWSESDSDLEIGMATGNQSFFKKFRCSCAKDTGDVKIQWPPTTSHSRDVRSTPHRSPMHSLYPSRTHKIKRSAPLAWSSLIEVFAEPLIVGMMRSSAPANIWAPKKLGASERKFIVCESIHARARLPHNRYSSIFLKYEILKRKNSSGFYQQYTFTNVYNFKYSKKIQNYSCVSRPPYNTYSLSPPLVL